MIVGAETAIWLAPTLPLIGALLIVLCDGRDNLRESVTIGTAIATFLVVLSLVPAVTAGERPSIQLGEMMPGLSLGFTLEPLGMLFALIASFLWIVTSVYAIGYMRGHHEQNQTRFYAFFAISIAATLGIAFSGNMLTLFVFYEILTLATFPLVTHSGTDEARRAGRIYLGVLLGTSIGLQLIAVIWTWIVAGTLDFRDGGILDGKVSDGATAALLALYVFGTGKAATMPFHRWLPAAMVAPTPVSALLHAVAVVKAGVFAILKVVVYIFGIDFLATIGDAVWLQYVAAATILVASLIAITKDNLKARLAYSTVSQLGYIVLGAMLATSNAIAGSGLHIATHAFGKITLFFCAGAILVASHKTEISDMRGLGRAMPFTMAAFFIGSLSIIGMPPFGGFWSKWYLASGALDAHQIAMVAVLMISSVLNIAYLLPIPLLAFFAPSDTPAGESIRIHEAPVACLLAIFVTAAGTIGLFFASDPIVDFLLPIAK